MEKITIERFCDVCNAADSLIESDTTEEVTLDGRTFSVDLCKTHYADTVGALLPFAPLAAKRKSKPLRECPVCGIAPGKGVRVGEHLNAEHRGVVPAGWVTCDDCGQVCHQRRGLVQHRRQAHGDGKA